MERQDLAELLSGTEAFSSVSPKAIELLLEAGEVKAIADSNVLIREGAMGESIWMLLEGKWVVDVKGEGANEIDRRGSVVGEISAVSHTPATATVKSEGEGEGILHSAGGSSPGNDGISRTRGFDAPLNGEVSRSALIFLNQLTLCLISCESWKRTLHLLEWDVADVDAFFLH